MSNNWILDVLTDLRSFARQNGYPVLADQLDDTLLVAATELEQKQTATRQMAVANDGEIGTFFAGSAKCDQS